MVNGVIIAYKNIYTTNTIQRIMINAIWVWESFFRAILFLISSTKIISHPPQAKHFIQNLTTNGILNNHFAAISSYITSK